MNKEREKVVQQLQDRLKVLKAEEAAALDRLNCLRGGIAEVEYAIAGLSEAESVDADKPKEKDL